MKDKERLQDSPRLKTHGYSHIYMILDWILYQKKML